MALLSLPDVGRLLVSCDQQGRASAALKTGARTATADVVVQTKDAVADAQVDPSRRYAPQLPPATAGVQQWSVSQFAEAHATIATMTVATRPVSASASACAVSAVATVIKQNAGTLTR